MRTRTRSHCVSRSSAIRNAATADTSHADTNSSASGDHLPQRDWSAANYLARSRKGKRIDDGTTNGIWIPDTDAVDHLIGRWDATQQRRVDGSGFHAIAELAWHADPKTPLLPTVNHKPDEGGALLIDWLLVNDAMRPHVIPDSYQVHVPPHDGPRSSDHRLITTAIDL